MTSSMSGNGDAVMSGRISTALTGDRRVIGEGMGMTIQRPSVSERTDRLNSAIDQVESAFAHLRGRLEPITLAAVPTPEMGGLLEKPDPSESSWISRYLIDVTSRVERLAEDVAGLSLRVDL